MNYRIPKNRLFIRPNQPDNTVKLGDLTIELVDTLVGRDNSQNEAEIKSLEREARHPKTSWMRRQDIGARIRELNRLKQHDEDYNSNPEIALEQIKGKTKLSGRYMINSGTVVAIPEGFTKLPNPMPEQPGYDYWRRYDVDCVFQPGDTVFFHFMSLADKTRLVPGEEDIYYIEHEICWAGIRNGELFCPDDYLLVEPEFEDSSNYVTQSGIIITDDIEMKPKIRHQYGTVRVAGRPPKREIDSRLEPGDKVLFDKVGEFCLKIQDKEYWSMSYQDVFAKFNNISN